MKGVCNIKTIIIKIDKILSSEFFTHITYNEVMNAIKNNESHIITPITACFSQIFIAKGYNIYVESQNKKICLNDLIKTNKIRPNQNAEKMLLSSCFGLVEDC